MPIVIIALAVAVGVLLFLVILQRREIKSISRQLREIKEEDTNELVHSSGSGKEFSQLINEINAMLREVQQSRIHYQQKQHDLEQMMINISHDLRTPLTSALGYVELIRRSDISEEEKLRELEVIHKRMLRLEELINSFFEFSKMISQSKPPEMQSVNLSAVLEESIVHYFDDFTNTDREIVLECDTHKLMMTSNKQMLMRIFDNIIGNSLKHGEGTLRISLESSNENETVISFENPTSDIEIDAQRVFDEFYTTDISRTKGSSGLGLAIAKQFTLMLGGTVSASADNSRFMITIKLPKPKTNT